MNYVKEYSRDAHNTTHFLTYADNNAVGYFVKQGFSKEILLEREKWCEKSANTLSSYITTHTK